MTARGRDGGSEAQWHALLGVAILGADRDANFHVTTDGPAGSLLAQAVSADPAQTMLSQAAILSIHGRAGRRLSIEPGSEPALAPADDSPACSANAGRQLSEILFGDFQILLPEWCALAEAAGLRAPDELLPELLRRAASGKPGEAAAIRSVLGDRGRWLAAQDPRWSNVLMGGDAEGAWHGGDIEDRVVALGSIRRADPELARTMLAESWEGEAADDREKLLPVLAEGLSQADEDFLESALDDRKAGVREAAAALLVLLPDSRYAARMTGRLRDLVTLSERRGLMRARTALEITLPEQPDKAMRRDGLSDRQQGGLGKKASLLFSMIAGAPLVAWDGPDPGAWVAAAAKSDWRESLLLGWARAAARQGNDAWAAALLDAVAGLVKSLNELELYGTVLDDAMAAAAPMRREAAVQASLGDGKIQVTGRLLSNCTHPWSPEFSGAVLAWLKERFPERPQDGWHLRELVKRDLGRRMDPAFAAEAATGWRRDEEGWTAGLEETIDRFIRTLEFRADMQKELKP